MSEENNVVDMAASKESLAKKKLEKKKKADSLSQAEVFDIYAEIIDRVNKEGSKFDGTFKAVETSAGDRFIVHIDGNGVCKPVKNEVIAIALTQHWKKYHRAQNDLFLSPKKADDVVKHWLRQTTAIENPRPLLWADEPGYCYRRLPFTYIGKTAFPTLFYELLDRMTNADAFCIFLGSLFYEQANRHQYVWIYGEGSDGKGALSRFLRRVFGSAYTSLGMPRPNAEGFWIYQLLSTRLGFFNECSSAGFPTSALMKMLTGGDPVPIEIKNGANFTADLFTKFIFTSNEQPCLSNERADHRRAIICEISRFQGKEDDQYEEQLWEQAQDILSYCRHTYEEFCAKNGHISIPVDYDDLSQYSSEEDDRFNSILRQYFILEKDAQMRSIQFGNIVREVFKDRRDERAFRAWLRRCYKIKSEMIRDGSELFRGYNGIRKSAGFLSEV